MKLEVLGIARDQAYSPGGHASNDRLILEATAHALMKRGCRVDLLTEEDVLYGLPRTPFVFSMCQGPAAIAALAAAERSDPSRLIINSATAVQGCYRARLYGRHATLTLFPQTAVLFTDDDLAEERLEWLSESDAWIKRGDVQTTTAADVQRVRTLDELRAALAGFRDRGIPTAVVQQHVEGLVVKFYGVTGTPFFAAYAESDHRYFPPAVHKARPLIERLMARLGLEIYGGDCVLGSDGRITVIDVNDWPSYAYFRRDAAEAIAGRLLARFGAQVSAPRRAPSLAHG
jgi:hypothetical protein